MFERYTGFERIEMAQGDPDPAWVLPGVEPKFALWSFGGGRPFKCKRTPGAGDTACGRWHAGIDCVGASDGEMIVATEKLEIVGVDRPWSEGSMAVFARTRTGLFLVFGGTKRGSGNEWGIKKGTVVAKGEPLGRVKGSYGMVHFETYALPSSRTSNSWWKVGKDAPSGLRNPLNYIQAAAGLAPWERTIQTWTQRRNALLALGYKPKTSGTWDASDTQALKNAQRKVDVSPDGVWGPDTDDAIRERLRLLGYFDQDEIDKRGAARPASEERSVLPVTFAAGGIAVVAGIWLMATGVKPA